jgi:hypothetical protein
MAETIAMSNDCNLSRRTRASDITMLRPEFFRPAPPPRGRESIECLTRE